MARGKRRMTKEDKRMQNAYAFPVLEALQGSDSFREAFIFTGQSSCFKFSSSADNFAQEQGQVALQPKAASGRPRDLTSAEEKHVVYAFPRLRSSLSGARLVVEVI